MMLFQVLFECQFAAFVMNAGALKGLVGELAEDLGCELAIFGEDFAG